MVIELRGVEFHNKGAELMLQAILQKIRLEKPNSVFVMERGIFVPEEKLRANKMFMKANPGKRREKIMAYFPKFVRRSLGFVMPDEINIILDGSGFAFGDLWGADYAGYRLANHISNWKTEGKKVILLPQALGPFTDENLMGKMNTIISNADLIFARDEVSFNYMKTLDPRANNIHLKPDFTNLVKGKLPAYFNKSEYEIAIIPNNKMVEKTSAQDGEAYLALLPNIIKKVQQLGYKPYFLIHEGKKDTQLAHKTNEILSEKIPVIIEDDPLIVKGIIGASKAVITSRFHGLVSSLAQAVPCLATGWSHKYEMLLKDYGFSEALLDVNIKDEVLENKLRLILDEQSRNKIITNLKKEANHQKMLTDEMWSMVFKKL